jgi:hypothetical protein
MAVRTAGGSLLLTGSLVRYSRVWSESMVCKQLNARTPSERRPPVIA